MRPEFLYLLVVIVAALTLFYTQRVRADITAMLVMLATILPWRLGPDGFSALLTPSEGFSGFGSPAVVTVGCMFVIGAAMVRTGAADLLGARLLGACAHREFLLQGAILCATTLFSMVVNDTTTVLVWMPVVISLCRERGLSPSRYLMCVAYGSLLGGQWTLVGTRSNLVISDYLLERSGEGLGFFEFSPAAAAVFIVGLLYFLLIGRRFLPKPTKEGLAEEYEVKEYLTEVMVTQESSTPPRTLLDVDVPGRFGVSVLSVIRGGEKLPAEGSMHIESGDVLVVQGGVSRIAELLESPDFRFKEELQLGERTLRSVDLVMAEAVVAPKSALAGHTLESLRFAAEYGLTVLGIFHRGRSVTRRPTAVPLEFGDSLLLVGHASALDRVRDAGDLILMEKKPYPIGGRRLAFLALGILVAMVVTAASGVLPPPVAVLIGAILVVLSGCLSLREVYKSVDWTAIVVVAGMIPFGLALEKTGAAESLASWLATTLAGAGPAALLAAYLFAAVLLTQLIENVAVAILLAPIGYFLAEDVGADPRPFLLGLCLAVSSSFMSPVAHESTILVMGPGRYRFRHYMLAGAGLALATWLMTTLVVPLYRSF